MWRFELTLFMKLELDLVRLFVVELLVFACNLLRTATTMLSVLLLKRELNYVCIKKKSSPIFDFILIGAEI